MAERKRRMASKVQSASSLPKLLTFFAGAQKRHRGRPQVTAANAPKGSPKQCFCPHPDAPAGHLVCILCLQRGVPAKECTYAMGQGNTNAWSHMTSVHGFVNPAKLGNTRQSQLQLGGIPLTKEKAWETLFGELIWDLRPFTFLESRGRAATQQKLVPSVASPSDDWFRSRLDREYEQLRARLRGLLLRVEFVQFYTILMDGWTLSAKGRLMYCARIQFLTDEMDLISIPVEISTIAGKDAALVGRWLQQALQRMGLPLSRGLIITADGAEKAAVESTSDLAAAELRNAKFNLPSVADDVNWLEVASKLSIGHVHCCDHRFSLVFKHGLEDASGGKV